MPKFLDTIQFYASNGTALALTGRTSAIQSVSGDTYLHTGYLYTSNTTANLAAYIYYEFADNISVSAFSSAAGLASAIVTKSTSAYIPVHGAINIASNSGIVLAIGARYSTISGVRVATDVMELTFCYRNGRFSIANTALHAWSNLSIADTVRSTLTTTSSPSIGYVITA